MAAKPSIGLNGAQFIVYSVFVVECKQLASAIIFEPALTGHLDVQ